MVSNVNISDFNRRWDRMTREMQDEVKDITEFYAGQIEREAKQNAPGGGDQIATEDGSEPLSYIVNGRGWTPVDQAIGYKMSPDRLRADIFIESSAGEVAVWIEMGTGQSAKTYLTTVPPEWRALAQKYYINGKGTILAKPYFLPAFFKYQAEYVKELKEMLARL